MNVFPLKIAQIIEIVKCGNGDSKPSCNQCWDGIDSTCYGDECGLLQNNQCEKKGNID